MENRDYYHFKRIPRSLLTVSGRSKSINNKENKVCYSFLFFFSHTNFIARWKWVAILGKKQTTWWIGDDESTQWGRKTGGVLFFSLLCFCQLSAGHDISRARDTRYSPANQHNKRIGKYTHKSALDSLFLSVLYPFWRFPVVFGHERKALLLHLPLAVFSRENAAHKSPPH